MRKASEPAVRGGCRVVEPVTRRRLAGQRRLQVRQLGLRQDPPPGKSPSTSQSRRSTVQSSFAFQPDRDAQHLDPPVGADGREESTLLIQGVRDGEERSGPAPPRGPPQRRTGAGPRTAWIEQTVKNRSAARPGPGRQGCRSSLSFGTWTRPSWRMDSPILQEARKEGAHLVPAGRISYTVEDSRTAISGNGVSRCFDDFFALTFAALVATAYDSGNPVAPDLLARTTDRRRASRSQ